MNKNLIYNPIREHDKLECYVCEECFAFSVGQQKKKFLSQLLLLASCIKIIFIHILLPILRGIDLHTLFQQSRYS